jgi:hypothetical protein
MSSENPSRFAELATEMLGAKVASDAVAQVFASASAEVKTALADAVLKTIIKRIHEPATNWAIEAVVSEHVSVAARLLVDEQRGEIEKRVAERLTAKNISGWIEQQVRAYVDTAAKAGCGVARLEGGGLMRKPTVGRIVHWTNWQGVVCAAIITAVGDATEQSPLGYVRLSVFEAGMPQVRTLAGVLFSADGPQLDHWHWPAREDG